MKNRMTIGMRLVISMLLAWVVSTPAYADQYLYPYGWNGGNGTAGWCLLSNGVSLSPTFQLCPGAGAGSGTVTSVAETVPGFLSLSGSPVTTSGTLAITGATGQTTHQVVGTGTTGTVGLLALTAADLPGSITSNTSGNAATATALAANPADCSANQYATAIDAGGNLTCAQPSSGQITGLSAIATSGSASDLGSGTLNVLRLPALTGGDCTTSAGSGALTCTKANGVTFAPIATSGSATDLSAGTVPASRFPALTGDVTNTVGTLATTVGKVNGASVPASATVLGSNSSSQLAAATTVGSGSVVLSAAAPTGAIVGTTDTQTLTNKTISGASNTISNVATTALTGPLQAAQEPAHTGDMTNTAGSLATTVSTLNGTTPGGTCTNQAVTSLSSSAVPTCTTLTSAYVNSSIALTGVDVNTSNQVTVTHLATALPVAQGGTGVTTSTGTGNTVLSTSPTLTTPALGTPSALVLTNATGLPAAAMPALTGDVTSTAGTVATTVVKINGNTPGGACTNQAVTSVSTSAVPTCTTLTSSYVDTSIAQTGVDINTSNQITATHLAAGLPATQGGTGQTTITLGDLIYGSASNVLSKLSGNTTSTKQFLSQTGNGTVSAVPAWGALTASDIQGLTPVWTQNQQISATEPRYLFNQSGAGTDLKLWDIDLASTIWCLRTRTDADAAGLNVLCATRGTTTNVSDISYGNATSNPTHTFLGSGTATFNGAVNTTSNFKGSTGLATAPTYTFAGFTNYGLYVSGSAIQFAIAGTGVGNVNANGIQFTGFSKAAYFQSIGTKFTTSGCSVSSTTGGATAGVFTLGANSCSVIITMNGATGATATNGWTCQAHDRTAATLLIGGESASTTTTATITIPVTAGATDVISFSCTAY